MLSVKRFSSLWNDSTFDWTLVSRITGKYSAHLANIYVHDKYIWKCTDMKKQSPEDDFVYILIHHVKRFDLF